MHRIDFLLNASPLLIAKPDLFPNCHDYDCIIKAYDYYDSDENTQKRPRMGTIFPSIFCQNHLIPLY